MSHPYFLYTIGIDSNFMCGFYLICTEAERGNFPSWLPHNIINFYCVRVETCSYDVIKVAYFFTAYILRWTLSAFSHNYILLGYVEHLGGEPSLTPITVKPDSND